MGTETRPLDVAIVGGGIAGASLATVLARERLDVLVLERDERYRDRNKGEVMLSWGWADAARMGLTGVLERAGGLVNPRWRGTLPDGSEAAIPVHALRADAPGTVSLGHVEARTSLAEAATEAGADVRFGVGGIDIENGSTPTVTWTEGDGQRSARVRLIVGADGRASRVRRLAGQRLQRSARTHVVASLLVGGTSELDEDVLVVRSSGRLLLAIPLAGQRARVYLVSREDRYTGAADAERMLEDCRGLASVADGDPLAGATPVGPCATYGGEDTWLESPVAGKTVLIGDAAGYNSPIIGQGLSLAMRDSRLVSELLLSADDWDESTFAPYVDERRERLRRVRFVAQLWAELWLRSEEEVLRLADDPQVRPLFAGLFIGYDEAPAERFTSEATSSLLGRLTDAELVAIAG